MQAADLFEQHVPVVEIARLFHVRYTERGVGYLLYWIGWSPQAPVHRAAERDEAAIATWRTETWSRVGRWPVTTGCGSASRTRPGSRRDRRRRVPGSGVGTRRWYWYRVRARAGCRWPG